jgi:hypothetical protein
MKKIILLTAFALLSFSSCSDDKSDCLAERAKITDRFAELIELAEGDDAQKAALIQQRDAQLKNLDC